MTYEIKDNPVHGRMLAESGKIIITDRDHAAQLAERFNAKLVKAHSNRYMLQLPQSANSIEECDCEAGQLQPDTYNQYPDHEVQMARQELYRTAKLAIMAHELLKHVGERQGLEGWIQSKLTRAADYIETVFDYLDYEMRYPSEMFAEADLNPGGSAQAVPGQTVAGQQNLKPGQTAQPAADGKNPTPGMVKMAKVDMNGKIQGLPIMVPQTQIKSKQQAGFRVIGESASAGASSAGGMASSMGFGNGFLNGGPGTVQRRKKKRKTTESTHKQMFQVTYGKPGEKGKFTGLKEAADKQEIVDYCTRKGLIFFDAQIKEDIHENTDKSHGAAYDRGSADSYYGRKSDPHKYVEMPDGSRKRVTLTDPAEVAAYKAGYAEESGRKDYGESVNESANLREMPSPRSMGRAGRSWADQKKSYDRQRHGYVKSYKDTTSVSKGDQQAEIDRLMKDFLDKGGKVSRSPAKAERVREVETAQKLEGLKDPADNPCWTGYHPVGTKKKAGRTVPNCVPNEGVEEGWKDVAAGAAMVGALGTGAYQGAKHSAPTTNIDGKQFVMYRHTPGDYERNKMKLTTDDAGNKVYAWVTTAGMKPQYTYRYYIPAEEGVKEEKAGLYANVQAKRERIKHGSGEHMRKPGTKGAPTSQSWKDAAKTAKTDESETGPKFTGYWKGTDKGKPGKKMVGSN